MLESRHMQEKDPTKLSSKERGVLKVFKTFGGQRKTKEEITGAVDLHKTRGEIPPYFSEEQLGFSLEELEEKKFLQREVVWKITDAAEEYLEKIENSSGKTPALARKSLMPAHIATIASPVRRIINPSLSVSRGEGLGTRVKKEKKPEPPPGFSEEVKEEPKRYNEIKKIGHKVTEAIDEMRSKNRSEIFLFREGETQISFLIDGRIKVSTEDQDKSLTIEEALGDLSLGYKKLDQGLQQALYKLSRSR